MTLGPCTLYVDADLLAADDEVCAPGSGDEPVDFDEIAERASQVVYVLTGRRYPGICEATVRPRRRGGCCGEFPSPFASYSCEDAITLSGPIADDPVVKIDGAAFTAFYIVDRCKLVRSDGRTWPSTQKLHLADTEDDTFSITYSFGTDAPLDVKAAAYELALEYVREATMDPRRKLPQGTASLSRQGQSITLDREVERARLGMPSLPALARAVATHNPTGQPVPPDVWSPDDEWDLLVIGL